MLPIDLNPPLLIYRCSIYTKSLLTCHRKNASRFVDCVMPDLSFFLIGLDIIISPTLSSPFGWHFLYGATLDNAGLLLFAGCGDSNASLIGLEL